MEGRCGTDLTNLGVLPPGQRRCGSAITIITVGDGSGVYAGHLPSVSLESTDPRWLQLGYLKVSEKALSFGTSFLDTHMNSSASITFSAILVLSGWGLVPTPPGCADPRDMHQQRGRSRDIS